MSKSALEQFRERKQKQSSSVKDNSDTLTATSEKISVNLDKFFEDIVPAVMPDSLPASPSKPLLPAELEQFQVLYNATFPGRKLNEQTSDTVLELINEAAEIINGTLTGRMWQNTLREHISALETYQEALYSQLLEETIPDLVLTLEWCIEDLDEAAKTECRELYTCHK